MVAINDLSSVANTSAGAIKQGKIQMRARDRTRSSFLRRKRVPNERAAALKLGLNGVLLGLFSTFRFLKNHHITFKFSDLTSKIIWVCFAIFNIWAETSRVGGAGRYSSFRWRGHWNGLALEFLKTLTLYFSQSKNVGCAMGDTGRQR